MAMSKSEHVQNVRRALEAVITAGITPEEFASKQMQCQLAHIEEIMGRATINNLQTIQDALNMILTKRGVR